MKKTILFAFIIFVVVLGITVGIFYTRVPKKEAPGLNDAVRLAQQATQTEHSQPDGVTFSFVNTPTLPTTLPAYGYQKLNRAEAEEIAQSAATTLGFTATPSAVIRGKTYTKTWSGANESSLVFSFSASNTSYIYRVPLPPASLKNANPESVARGVVSLFNTGPAQVKVLNTQSGPFDGILLFEPRPAIPLRGYSLSYVLGDYSIAPENMNISAAAVVLDANNVVRSATVNPALSITTQGGAVSILTTDQILASLTQKRGAIINVGAVGSPELSSLPAFVSFQINNTALFYAPNDGLMLPALLLAGKGITKTGEVQSATLFLWAFPAGQ